VTTLVWARLVAGAARAAVEGSAAKARASAAVRERCMGSSSG
jgi:hypothetical protein